MMIFVDGGNLPTLGNILTASVNNYKKNQDVWDDWSDDMGINQAPEEVRDDIQTLSKYPIGISTTASGADAWIRLQTDQP